MWLIESKFFKRFLEIIPASLTWTALLLPIIFAFKAPIFVGCFVIAFDLYWLFRALSMGVHLILGYSAIKYESQINWLQRCQKISHLASYKQELERKIAHLESSLSFFNRKLRELKTEYEEILQLEEKEPILKNWQEIYHVILLANYKEDLDILEPSLDSYLKANYPVDKKVILVLACEEREGPQALERAQYLKNKYQGKFADFLISVHPDGIVGELKGKGANVDWAARMVLKPYLDKRKIPYDNVIVSTFDADTRVHPEYFACLTYRYITNPNRTRRSYQPIPIYANNIWHTGALMRLIAFGSSFWQMIESVRPYRMINFSSQAMSFQTLVEIDFWDKTIVNEDSRQFWRAYFAFDGDHEVIPIFTPVYMDAVLAPAYWRTIRNQYKQKQRWAYGIEHFPYIVIESIKNKSIKWRSKLIWILRTLEGHFSWATSSIFIATGGWLPIFLNPAFKKEVLFLNLPIFASRILTVSWIGIIISAYIAFKLLPPRPPQYKKGRVLAMFLQWILIPLSAIFFGSIPAIDAQTRLALGKYLGFWVTEKVAKEK